MPLLTHVNPPLLLNSRELFNRYRSGKTRVLAVSNHVPPLDANLLTVGIRKRLRLHREQTYLENYISPGEMTQKSQRAHNRTMIVSKISTLHAELQRFHKKIVLD